MICQLDCQQEPYIFKCGADKCAKNQTECRKYLNYEKTFSSHILGFILKSSYLSEKNKEESKKLANDFIFFKSKINVCPKINAFDVSKGICIRNRFCFKIRFKSNLYKINNLPKESCLCTGKYSFQCDNTLCATNKNMCDFFKANQSLNLITQRCDYHLF